MNAPVTLYRFRIDLSDIDRGVYETLDFRVAMHPSETHPYLLTRVLAYVLNYEEGLEFSGGGLSDPDQPAIAKTHIHGGHLQWIEVGNASARKLHRAAKASQTVKVYTYKDPQSYLRELSRESIHEAERLEIYSLPSRQLEELGEQLERDNSWSLVHQEGLITLTFGDSSSPSTVSIEMARHRL